MKTKTFKTCLILIAFISCIGNINAQKTYLKINTGYGFKVGSQNSEYFNFINRSSDASNNRTYKQINFSLGKGINLGGTLGYMFNKNIGVEVGLDYLIGHKYEASTKSTNSNPSYINLSSKMIRINPSVILSTANEKINPYAKFGFVIGSGYILYEEDEYVSGNHLESKHKMNGGFAFGLSSAIGINYKLNDNTDFFGELNIINMSYSPKKAEMTEYKVNGVDNLLKVPTYYKEIEFEDEISENSNTPINESQPNKVLKQSFSFGSFGLNIGLKINI